MSKMKMRQAILTGTLILFVGIFLSVTRHYSPEQQKEPQKKEKKVVAKKDTTDNQIQLEQRIMQKQMEINKMKLDSLNKEIKRKKGGGQ